MTGSRRKRYVGEKSYRSRSYRAVGICSAASKFPTIKVLESFDFKAQPSVNKPLVLELMRCGYIDKRENLLLIGSTGTGKTHLATALGMEACGRGKRVRFHKVIELVTQMIEAREQRKRAPQP